MEFRARLHSVVKGVHNDHPAEQCRSDILKTGVRADQLIGHADHAGFLQDFFRFEFLLIPDRGERQEGCPACLFLLQHLNHALGCRLVLGDHILNVAAERDLNCRLVSGIRLDQVCDDADQTRLLLFMLHDALDAVAEALIALSQICKRVQPRFFLLIGEFRGAHFLICLRQFGLFARDRFLYSCLFGIQFLDLLCQSVKSILQVQNDFVLPALVRPDLNQSAGELSLAHSQLFFLCRQGSHAGFDSGTLIQNVQNCILLLVDLIHEKPDLFR